MTLYGMLCGKNCNSVIVIVWYIFTGHYVLTKVKDVNKVV
jgi:hypothetical protein